MRYGSFFPDPSGRGAPNTISQGNILSNNTWNRNQATITQAHEIRTEESAHDGHSTLESFSLLIVIDTKPASGEHDVSMGRI
mmetsp:Transcript_29218/g.45933  ORF Transcript_29218/g.45933 Transcript_29218/m.45933 type:complete len:82 (+) Transcript_29218:2624-2869(+)